MIRVLSYDMLFNPGTKRGRIRIKLADQNVIPFNNLDSQDFAALNDVLQNDPVFWNGHILTTREEFLDDGD